MENVEIDKMRNEFLKNLGGQSHVQCQEHRLPLISSTERSNKCQCGKKEFYRCCDLDCKVCLCKHCYKNCDENTTTFIPAVNQVDLDDSDTSDDDEDSLEEPQLPQDGDYLLNNEDDEALHEGELNEEDEVSHEGENNIEDDAILDREDFTNYVTTTLDADIPLDFDDDIENDTLPQDEDENVYIDHLPSTDAGDFAFEIEETTKYGGLKVI